MNTMLIVEDEETLRESIGRLFEREGYKVDLAESAEAALDMTEGTLYDIVLSDIILPGMDGLDMLIRLREAQPDQTVIIMTAYASVETSVKALRAGAYDYIMKPIMHDEIRQVVRNALRQKQLMRENLLLRRQVDQHVFREVIGTSAALRSLMDDVAKVADTRSNVLLLGETGTGKELFARIIHRSSSRRDMPFVPINCSAIPENLLESELFGHAKGAFTGALTSRSGLLAEADGGTVFLDEIGDMPPSFQVKLLRVIEDHQIRMVGSSKARKVDLRFIAATNRDLETAVRDADFREDLYYRINVITLKLPPLRQRRQDVAALVGHYLERFARESGKPVPLVTAEAMGVLDSYDWPGNVRELQNVMERAVLLSEGGEVDVRHLPASMHSETSFAESSIRDGLSIEAYTRAFIARYQESCGEQELAERLGITRKTLWEKRKKWDLRKP